MTENGLEELHLLPGMRCSVSSVLNRDSASYGRSHLFDGSEESCWNSEQGTPQWIAVKFPEPVEVREVRLMFQGGFVGQECAVEQQDGKGKTLASCDFFPDDVNHWQSFPVSLPPSTRFKLRFGSSTDFFGRVTVYQAALLGVRQA